MASRFLQLFKRGRYVSLRALADAEAASDQATLKRKREERERFVVAAIAFCLDHDARFKAHFLGNVANLKPSDITSVTVEPERWGDLVLKGRKHVLVVEFKLGALLQSHQAPDQKEFYDDGGYGKKILNHYGKRARYIVVGIEKAFPRQGKLVCGSVPWRKLLVKKRRESRIEKDLFDCLANLGAPVFLNRHMKQKQLVRQACAAMDVYAALHQALATAGLESGESESGPSYFGVNISGTTTSSSSPQSKKLSQLIQSGRRKRTLGWIGYEVDDADGEPRLSAWFYSSKKNRAKVQERLRGEKSLGQVEPSGAANVSISSPAAKHPDNVAWFRKVLRLLT